MTREEAIKTIENAKHFAYDDIYEEAFDMAIKALEQEPILGKIRAEIISRDRNVKAIRSDGCCFFTAEEVLQILDKYKADSEDKG